MRGKWLSLGGAVLLFATQSALAEEAASKPNIFPPWL
jgi:hypothetical protein